MDIGSILSIDLDLASKVLESAGSMATLASCVHQIMSKYGRDAVVEKSGSRTKVPLSNGRVGIDAALNQTPRPKAKPKPKK
jgi:hypothetical protein